MRVSLDTKFRFKYRQVKNLRIFVKNLRTKFERFSVKYDNCLKINKLYYKKFF